jgi:hypothetical protein
MRKVLALFLVMFFLATPAMAKVLKPFQPPSPKKMTKAPLFPNKPLASLLKPGK